MNQIGWSVCAQRGVGDEGEHTKSSVHNGSLFRYLLPRCGCMVGRQSHGGRQRASQQHQTRCGRELRISRVERYIEKTKCGGATMTVRQSNGRSVMSLESGMSGISDESGISDVWNQ